MFPSGEKLKAMQVTGAKIYKWLKMGPELPIVNSSADFKVIDSQPEPP